MGYKTLGLDLGIASIGWAYISEDNGNIDLLGWGSRIFEPGMDDDISSGKGTSRCAERRLKRALRIQYARRRKRKDALVALLTLNGLLPEKLTPDFFVETDRKLLDSFPQEERARVGHLIPYLYRKKALDEELEPFVLGRTLFHLAQRRGYLSNRKQELKEEEESGKVKNTIAGLNAEMQKSGARTLGEYFSGLHPEKIRIRGEGHYTDRAMYQQEFRLICQRQRHLIPEALEKELYKAIFFQRKLRSCKGLIGHCTKYPEEFRCSFAEEEAQLFRIYTTVNNLRIESKGGALRTPDEEERKKLIALLNGFSDLFTLKGTIALSKLGKALPLAKGEKFTLADEQKEIYGNVLHAALFKVFGERAEKLTAEEQKLFFHDLNAIQRDDILKKRLKGHWGLSEIAAETASKVVLPDTYCAFSLKALRELLPDLESGIPLSTLLKFDVGNAERPLEKLPRWDSPECNIELRNPVVHRVMTELHRVVNAIIDRYGKPDAIRIELARDLKSSNKERERITKQLREREKERAAIAARIAKEAGITNPSRNDILKVMLADECDFTCPYTGKSFSMTELLHGRSIQIEHIIPFSRSFDDAFRNKTLCDSSANSAKSNRTPFEAFHGERYEEILQRVAHFKGPFAEYKLELFKADKIEDADFLSRNLNDTRYASKLAMRYLAKLYGGIVDATGRQRIFAVSGGHTALVRRAWGGNYLLGEGEKVRTDHRHHAIDALTIALTEPSLVQKIAKMTPEERRYLHDTMTPLLGNRLFQQAKEKMESAAVSHHTVNKLRGAFHKETIYSKEYGAGVHHVRVALWDLTVKDFPDIVDRKIKELILQKLGKNSESELENKDFEIFKEPANLPCLLDQDGNPVNIIHKVRIARNVTTRTIGSGDSQREVANGANYLLAIFAQVDESGNETGWTGEIVTLMDACLKHQRHLPLFEKERPGVRFKFTLQKGDIVTWEKEGKKMLCIVRGISLPQFHLVSVKDARMKKDLQAAKCWFQPTLLSAFQGHLTKYNMNLFGELQRAND